MDILLTFHIKFYSKRNSNYKGSKIDFFRSKWSVIEFDPLWNLIHECFMWVIHECFMWVIHECFMWVPLTRSVYPLYPFSFESLFLLRGTKWIRPKLSLLLKALDKVLSSLVSPVNKDNYITVNTHEFQFHHWYITKLGDLKDYINYL